MKRTITHDAKTARIRALNDALRTTRLGGGVAYSFGFAALSEDARDRFMAAQSDFHKFNSANDTYGEHDFGAIEVDGERIFFKIDYYDNELLTGSPDPSDPAVTTRVMTLMLADEY